MTARPEETEDDMSIEFAEKILDGMVDEHGNCGERGMSAKQYEVICHYLRKTEPRRCGGWEGDRAFVPFYEWDAEGTIGRYQVKLHCLDHFHLQVVVESIRRWIDEVPTFEGSEWQGEPKQRMELELTVVRRAEFERPAYTYGYEWVNVYTLADAEGNCYVWKSTSWLGAWQDDGDGEDWVDADPGDKVTMRATVKEHSEYRGIKQTVINRPKVKAVEKRTA